MAKSVGLSHALEILGEALMSGDITYDDLMATLPSKEEIKKDVSVADLNILPSISMIDEDECRLELDGDNGSRITTLDGIQMIDSLSQINTLIVVNQPHLTISKETIALINQLPKLVEIYLDPEAYRRYHSLFRGEIDLIEVNSDAQEQ